MKILCVGQAYCDIALAPVPNRILGINHAVIEPPRPAAGGDGLNVATVLAKLGEESYIAGYTGTDENGKIIRRLAESAGVRLDYLKYSDQYTTAVSYILIMEDGERHFLVDPSIEQILRPEDVTDEMIQEADVVYLGSALIIPHLEDEGIYNIFKRAHQYGKLTAMDASASRPSEMKNRMYLLDKTLGETDIFIPSTEEVQLLTGETDIMKMMECFANYPLKVFGIKMGESGCILTDFRKIWKAGCFHVFPVVDTTGAGDSFMGGFLCEYLKTRNIPQTALFASGVSAHTISALGATSAVPDYDTVKAFVEKYGNTVKIEEKEWKTH